jgi:hypothetical protein
MCSTFYFRDRWMRFHSEKDIHRFIVDVSSSGGGGIIFGGGRIN